ncbi:MULTISPECIES: glycine--tRNA ligase subunit beta [unclassified Hyphomonas]|jgi:glycyl-tRNA synthetase beta chain|uniref:glycine--tRNA ligase subunit beta n=2 Tax=Hyphomonas TaxID=85 RepID=UPI000E92110B|nr:MULTISPECIES: glycine--tRNA ligase subunit beta [unclassified Hyphomonas]HBN92715.1 glycine--tRNA ligase subunit beta [Hyphomonas sp.]HBT36163.1 glycine--tRNA ligase subunit beta [Hyphomonas sp.]HBU35871.1 glycine--tRNA ligase subunit beta [Hyphomonas sp.]HBX91913.1 glycine--tRNA ligase subunit beta [Hyphomonas sp.]HCX12530.1 glycine--tRNA ligase subunit beta [Hyphomonas sp.]|tara:strand:- start:955 stop:3069 length:2115 start_codon:yes stop_codon:yes gene_type:complete
MADLILELFSEEIPARMQAKAESDLGTALEKALGEAGLNWSKLETASGPRRLTVFMDGLTERSADVKEERKGPKVGAPDKAVEGFLRGAGLSDISQAEVRSDPKKGDFYVAVIETPGRDATDIIAEAVPAIIRGFHWPKSMRWGTGDLRWVRPLQRIVCVLDGKVVPFEVDGISSGDETEGHRVHGRGPFKVTFRKDYESQLSGAGHVKLTRDARREVILAGIEKVCAEAGLEWIEDKGLLEEVVGLAEWPVVVLGDMDPAFLALPPEVIQLSMRTHQKYFAVNDRKTGKLAPNFIVVANIEAADGGKKLAEGNSRVLSARLDDGRFFWEKDKATPLEDMAEKLSTIAFKAELGSLGDKVERVAALAHELAPKVGADPGLAERAARLAKADLVSEMVGEFPELQGVMGRYYALEAGEPAAVADAIRDHYKPQGPSDSVPTDPVSIAVALADKLDTLVGFWAIDEKPTGSKDPFALRRAALGVVRITLANDLRLGFQGILGMSDFEFQNQKGLQISDGPFVGLTKLSLDSLDLLSFFADRLKQHLRDEGQRHDLIDAVFALGEDDLVLITRRVEALGAFLDTEDGANLLAGYKRAANILKAEEKKGDLPADLSVNDALIAKGPAEEKALAKALSDVEAAIENPLKSEDFTAAMAELAKLRGPVDAFFEAVMVNDEDSAVRANRLALLTKIRGTLHRVADFSRIDG